MKNLILLLLTRGILTSSQSTDTFKGCAVPSFEWATYSTSSLARMYAMRGAVTSGRIFAAGYIKSTTDTDLEADNGEIPEFELT